MSNYKQFVSEVGVTAFDAARTYNADDLVTYSGTIYKAKAAVAAGPFNANDWTALAPAASLAGKLVDHAVTAAEGEDDDFILEQISAGFRQFSQITGGYENKDGGTSTQVFFSAPHFLLMYGPSYGDPIPEFKNATTLTVSSGGVTVVFDTNRGASGWVPAAGQETPGTPTAKLLADLVGNKPTSLLIGSDLTPKKVTSEGFKYKDGGVWKDYPIKGVVSPDPDTIAQRGSAGELSATSYKFKGDGELKNGGTSSGLNLSIGIGYKTFDGFDTAKNTSKPLQPRPVDSRGAIAIGANALALDTTNFVSTVPFTDDLDDCVAIGRNALGKVEGASTYSIGIGCRALSMGGMHSIAIGRDAAANANADSEEIIAIGNRALDNARSIKNVVAIGSKAAAKINRGLLSTSPKPKVADVKSVFIGNRAGTGLDASAVINYTDNVVIGHSAGSDPISDTASYEYTNCIIIGSEATPSGQTGITDEITLGNSRHSRFRIPGINLDTAAASDGDALTWLNSKAYWQGGVVSEWNSARIYALNDVVVKDGKIYKGKGTPATPGVAATGPTAGTFDPTEWDRSLAGTNFDTKPDDSVGVDGDVISVSKVVTRNYCFRTKSPARDPAHSFSHGTMNGLVNDGVAGSKDYILVRQGPPLSVQMYIVGKMTSPFPDGTIVHWEVDKFTWSSHVETKLEKGAANTPPSFSGTPTEWDKLIDDIAADPPNVQYIDVWGFAGRTTPAVRFFARENGAWEELYGEMDSISTGLVSRTPSGAIAARGLSFEKDKFSIINYVDLRKYPSTYAFGGGALEEICAGTVDDPQGKRIIAIGAWAGKEASSRLSTGAKSEPSGESVAIGDVAAMRAKTLYRSTIVGSGGAASANSLSKSCFFGRSEGGGYTSGGGSQYFEFDQCTAIGEGALIPSGSAGKIEKCTALGASAGHSADSSANAAAATRLHTLCAGSHNVTLLGYNAEPTGTYKTPSVNQIVLGDANVANLYCNARTIHTLSDERDKKDITDLSLGLDFINGLRPVSFEWDRRDNSFKGVKSVGFIAQEVLKAENDSGMRDHLQMVDDHDPDKLRMSEGQLVPILTKAVQELSAQVEELKKEIAALKGA